MLIFIMEDKPKEIKTIAVVREIEYLGVVINDKKNCCKTLTGKMKFVRKR